MNTLWKKWMVGGVVLFGAGAMGLFSLGVIDYGSLFGPAAIYIGIDLGFLAAVLGGIMIIVGIILWSFKTK